MKVDSEKQWKANKEKQFNEILELDKYIRVLEQKRKKVWKEMICPGEIYKVQYSPGVRKFKVLRWVDDHQVRVLNLVTKSEYNVPCYRLRSNNFIGNARD